MYTSITFTSSIFRTFLWPALSSHMNFMSRVFPHPVSPISITGIPHLERMSN